MNNLITKYRPKVLADVIGQAATIKSLDGVLKAGTARSFLFIGPAGTGKTTLARIVAARVGCHPTNIIEIDAATNSGIDEMRKVTDGLAFRGMSGSGTKMVIVDECHSLSKNAWQALLKIIEEPHSHLYWALCTTEADKVPEAQMTRCAKYTLNHVDDDDILDLLRDVAKKEGLSTPDKVLTVAARAARGSPRAALSALVVVAYITSAEEAATLLREAGKAQKDVIELLRLMLNNSGFGDWKKVADTLKQVDTRNPESIRITITRYLAAVALNAPGKASRALEIMSAFETPYPQQSGIGPLLLSFGRLVLRS